MLKKTFAILLLIIGISYGTVSLSQTVYKTVPDSLVCITPKQDIFLLQKVFEAKEYQTSNVINQRIIAGLEAENNLLNLRIEEKDKQLNLAYLETNNCLAEKEYLSKNLRFANRGKQLLKVGFFAVSIVAVLETGFILISK